MISWYLACVCFLFRFSCQRPLVPALHISTPIVISMSNTSHHARRSLHLHHSHPLTPPSLTVSSPTALNPVTMAHVIAGNNNSVPGTPTKLSHSYGYMQPHTAPAITHKSPPHSNTTHFAFDFAYSSPVPEENHAPSSPPGQNARSTTSPVKVLGSSVNRRSSDSDISTPPKGEFFPLFIEKVTNFFLKPVARVIFLTLKVTFFRDLM